VLNRLVFALFGIILYVKALILELTLRF